MSKSALEKKYIERINSECKSGDTEKDHTAHDKILIELLRELGYTELSDICEGLTATFWYA